MRSRAVTYGLGLAFGAIRIRPRGTRLQRRHQPLKLLAMKILFQIYTVIVATFCLLQQATAQDPVKQSPDKYKVVLNNDKVRVLDVRLKPGDKSPMHSHPNRLSYVLSGSTVKSTSKDGKTTEVKTKAGSMGVAQRRVACSGESWQAEGSHYLPLHLRACPVIRGMQSLRARAPT